MVYYYVTAALSTVLTLFYAYIWRKQFDVNITMIFSLISIVEVAYLINTQTETLDAAIICMKVIYLGGCFLQPFITLSIFSLCKIKVKRITKSLIMTLCMLMYASVLTIGKTPLFYKSVSYKKVNGMVVINREYGVAHTIFYVMIVLFFAAGLTAIIYSYLKKRDVSRKIIYLLFMPEIICIVSYVFNHVISPEIELIAGAYVIAQIVYIIIISRVSLYNVDENVIDSLVQTGDTGFISFDLKKNYLGSNETAKGIFPQLGELTVDLPASKNQYIKDHLLSWIEEFDENNEQNQFHYNKNGRFYLVDLKYLYYDKNVKGYQFIITDDTRNQQYISLLDKYNTSLKEEVEKKTRHIVEMHDNLILSMATMVESRDNSTGGHIRRTSKGVSIIMNEIMKDNVFGLSDEFCRDIIKAAPMHDLGKIAVDDAVLRKPGRFTDEEYAIMKTHSAQGAKIVREILKATDDEQFKIIAENVAHYHHERYDGSGYPEGLKGEEIPLEARIMAIADVYDALVSKRVYKEKMSFEKADSIIMEGMGTQFDKALEKYYVSARPALESYYSSLES